MFKKWLFNPTTTLSGKISNIIIGFLIDVNWLIFIITLLAFIIPYGYGSPQPLRFHIPEQFPSRDYIFFGIILAPLWEELAFRHAPFRIARWFEGISSKHNRGEILIPVMIISTIIFGWGHGNGPISLLIQGVGGFIMATVYIKNNYSYWSSVAVHAMWNTFCLFLI